MQPSQKFIGRPSRPCPKCGEQWHWVNMMGGIECVTCRPAPESVADIESRYLVSDSGSWQQPGDFDMPPWARQSAVASANNQSSSSATIKQNGDLLDVFTDSASIHGDATSRHWDAQQQALVNWWMDLTKPGSAMLLEMGHRLRGQRLSRWQVVTDAGQLIDRLRADCESGPAGPRELDGCLTQELRELRCWIDGHGEENAMVSVCGAGNVGFDLSGIEI
jgi:hypothetical protein